LVRNLRWIAAIVEDAEELLAQREERGIHRRPQTATDCREKSHALGVNEPLNTGSSG
jgi:hypothetical protein